MAKFIITPEAKEAYNAGKSVQVIKNGKQFATIDRPGLEKFFNGASVPPSSLRQGYPGCTIDVIK